MTIRIDTQAIVCSLRNHGEHGGVIRLMTPQHGLVVAYVRGARGRRMRPLLIPGNLVSARLRARSDSQLPQASVELVRSRAPVLAEPLPAAGVEWITTLIAATLPEQQPYPIIYEMTAALLQAIEAAPSASGWATGLVRLELLLIAELGYGRRLPGLPESIRQGVAVNWPDVLTGMNLSGRLLDRYVLAGLPAVLADTRARLVDRLKRAAQ